MEEMVNLAPEGPAGKKATGKPPLDRETLRDVIDLALWAGQMLLQHGAETQRVEETVHHLGTGLGCDWMDILVSPNVILVTTTSGDEFRTKTRRVVRMGVDMTRVSAINALSRRVVNGEMNRFQVRAYLERIDKNSPHYNRWLVVLMVGLACAAFSRLSGGDIPAGVATFFAAATAMFVRQELTKQHFNPLLVVTVTAFVAGLLAASTELFAYSATPAVAISSAALLLVPGVPLINAAEDLIKGHLLVGLARGLTGLLVSLAIALGLMLALWLTGVRGL